MRHHWLRLRGLLRIRLFIVRECLVDVFPFGCEREVVLAAGAVHVLDEEDVVRAAFADVEFRERAPAAVVAAADSHLAELVTLPVVHRSA